MQRLAPFLQDWHHFSQDWHHFSLRNRILRERQADSAQLPSSQRNVLPCIRRKTLPFHRIRGLAGPNQLRSAGNSGRREAEQRSQCQDPEPRKPEAVDGSQMGNHAGRPLRLGRYHQTHPQRRPERRVLRRARRGIRQPDVQLSGRLVDNLRRLPDHSGTKRIPGERTGNHQGDDAIIPVPPPYDLRLSGGDFFWFEPRKKNLFPPSPLPDFRTGTTPQKQISNKSSVLYFLFPRNGLFYRETKQLGSDGGGQR